MPFLIVIAIIIGILIAFLQKEYNSPNNKGKRGEAIVSTYIDETIPDEQYVINNLYLRDQEGKTCQIDHIVINKNGVFVIETKNYSGRIYGQENQQYWTQVLNYGKEKHKLYNPLKQNATHIYMLRKMTGTKLPIKSIVVFIKGNIKYIDSANVYTLGEMKAEINRPQGANVTPEEMKRLYNKIIGIRNTEENSEQEHIEKINRQKIAIANNKCPRCGGELKKRNGKYGTFYGCSNYPNCKFTK